MDSSNTLINAFNAAMSLSEAVIVLAVFFSIVFIVLGAKNINTATKLHTQYGFRLSVLTVITSPFLFIPLAFYICSCIAIKRRREFLQKERRKEIARAQKQGGTILLPPGHRAVRPKQQPANGKNKKKKTRQPAVAAMKNPYIGIAGQNTPALPQKDTDKTHGKILHFPYMKNPESPVSHI